MQFKNLNYGSKKMSKLAIIGVLVMLCSGVFGQNVYTVTTTADSDPMNLTAGTLRWAITAANSATVASTINFNIPSSQADANGFYNLVLSGTYGSLPIITQSVTIDGSTQPLNGYTGVEPVIVIKGDNLQNYSHILSIGGAGGNIIQNLSIQNLPLGGSGILISGSNNTISNNTIYGGVLSAYTYNLYIYVSPTSNNNVINNNYLGTDVALNRTISDLQNTIVIGICNGCFSTGNDPISVTNSLIENNIVRNVKAGISTSAPVENARITKNIVYNILGTGRYSVAIDEESFLYNSPSLSHYSNGIISGSAQPYDIIEIFGANSSVEAQAYLTSVTADANGNWSATIGNLPWTYITASATQNAELVSNGGLPNTSALANIQNSNPVSCPSATTASNNSPFCAGNTLNLSTPAISGATYSWTGPNNFTSSTQNPSITNVSQTASGTYTVTISATGCSNISATTIVSVSSPTITATSNSAVAIGQTLNLSASDIDGGTYVWSGPNGFTSTEQNPSITNVTDDATGTYTVTGTVNGCSSSATVTVAVGDYANCNYTFPANAPVFTVETAADADPFNNPNIQTLRWAITQVNNSSVPGIIQFNIPASEANNGLYTITADPNIGSFPAISNSFELDGTSQAGYTTGQPNVVIDLQQNVFLINNVTNGNIKGLYFKTILEGASCFIFSKSSCILIEDNIFENPTNVGAYTLTFDNLSTLLFENNSNYNTVKNNTFNGITIFFNVFYLGSSGGFSFSNDNVVELNTFSVAEAVLIGSNDHIKISQNIYLNSTPPIAQFSVLGNIPSNDGIAPPKFVNTDLFNFSGTTVPGGVVELYGCNGNFFYNQGDWYDAPNFYYYIKTVIADAQGNWSADLALFNYTRVGATVTDQNNNTSFMSFTDDLCPRGPASSNTPVCINSDINLYFYTPLQPVTYNWTGPNQFASTTSRPVITNTNASMAGTYSVAVSVYGCTTRNFTTDVAFSNVQALNSINASSNSPVAVYAPINLSTSTVRTDLYYIWQGPASNNFTSYNVQNPNVTQQAALTDAGTYTLTIYDFDCGQMFTATTDVVVSSTICPTSITAGSYNLCDDGTLNLSVTNVAGGAYSWKGPNAYSSTLQNPSISNVTQANAGTYTVTVAKANCPSVSATAIVNILNAQTLTNITATSDGPVCAGGPIQLNASDVGGATYSWAGPANFTSTLQNPAINYATAANAGTYTVTVTACTNTIQATVDVTVGALTSNYTITAVPISCKTFSISYTGPTLPTGAQWAYGDGTFSNPITDGSTSIVHTYPTSGKYTITLSGAEAGACPVVGLADVSDFVTADFSYLPLNYCQSSAGLQVNIDNYNTAYSYQWEVNGGYDVSATQASSTLTSGLVNVKNVVRLIITNPATGCTTNVSKVIKIGAPDATFITPGNVCLNQPMNISNIKPDGDSYTWTLLAPDNSSTTLTGVNPYYAFSIAGNYTLTLQTQNTYTDASGTPVICTNTSLPFNIAVSTPPQANFSVATSSCSGGVTINLSPNTSITAYSLDYGDGTTVQTGTSYPSQITHQYANNGLYNLTFMVFNGACYLSNSGSISINDNTNFYITPIQANLCGSGASTELSPYFVNLSSNAGTLSYSWTGPNGFSSANNVIKVSTAGTYTLHVTSNGTCPVDITRVRTVMQLAQPTASIVSTTNEQCDGTLGSATIQLALDLVGQGYSINGNSTAANSSATAPVTTTINGLNAGDNFISIANGIDNTCNSQVKVHINENLPELNLSVTQPTSCTGSGSTGSAQVSPSSPQTGSNSVNWYSSSTYPASPITTGNSVSSLNPGTYIVELTNGICKVTQYFNIGLPVINLSMKNNNLGTCSGAAVNAEVDAQSSLTGAYNYVWKQADANSNFQVISGSGNTNSVAVGSYEVDVTSSGTGCTSSIYFKVKKLLPLVASFTVVPPDCKHQGQITPSVSGGDGNYEFTWTLGTTTYSATTTPVLSLAGLTSSSAASLTVNDNSGCVTTYPANSTSPVTITVAPPVTLIDGSANCTAGGVITGSLNSVCQTSCDISVAVQGGVPPYNFQWYLIGNQTYNVNHVFSLDANNNLVIVGVDASGNALNTPTDANQAAVYASFNADNDPGTYFYPYWNFSVLGIATPVLQSTASPYSFLEQITNPAAELYVAGASGASGAPAPNGDFITGNYEVKVTDAIGCTTTLNVGTINFDPVTTFPVAFTYVWGGNPTLTPVVADNPDAPDPDMMQAMVEAADEMQDAADKCFQQQTLALASSIKTNCSDLSQLQDQLSIIYNENESHYTLYYYDRAGRLTKTVPPEGVQLMTQNQINQLKVYRVNKSNSPSLFVPAHRMTTTYDYNSLDQLVSQNTPDGGTTNFIYDGKSRLRFSQNAQQAVTGKYSYTLYDDLGRIVEVGESSQTGLAFNNGSAQAANLVLANTDAFPDDNTAKTQLTKTVYTNPAAISYYGQPQNNLQNRVSYSYVDNDPTIIGDEYYTYYSYDAHGNVEWLVQQDPDLGKNYIAYEYDLVSGKVLKVRYNENRADKYFHRYTYDAENRITNVETSRDGNLWDNDASYQYYAHGPLKRTVIGEDHVQGLDNVYTIQGWLKSINTPHLNAADDPGNDAGIPTATATGQPWNTTTVAQDRFGMMLNYFQGDYTRTGNYLFNGTTGTGSTANINVGDLYAQANSSTNAPDLFNGNISSWVQSQVNQTFAPINARAELFEYDVLNRIKQSTNLQQSASTWAPLNTGANTFKTSYDYDGNGNILDLNRYDNTGALMDKLSYTYDNGAQGTALNKNQLSSVSDDASATVVNGRGDLEGTHTYSYDAIGNLITDVSQERLDLGDGNGYQLYTIQSTITWNVYGKITQINKTVTGTTFAETISFIYDAAGNRTQKQVAGNMHPPQITYYVRDAQGNTMAVYAKGEDPMLPGQTNPTYSYSLIEQPIYGSSRIGENKGRIALSTASTLAALTPPGDGLNAISEYQNWITSSNKAEQLLPGGTDQLCECKINTIQGANYNQTGTATEFLGIAENGVAMAEDLNRNMLFYAILAQNYLGNNNACLVYDNTGQLMKGTDLIGAIEPNSKPIIVNITGTNQYAIITLNNQHVPVYHIVDMDKTGYGTVNPAGEVVQANLPMTNYSGIAPSHGWHFTAYEDHVNNKTIVYTSRFKANTIEPFRGTTEIVAYDFGNNFTVQPQEHVIYQMEGCGITESGELQISPHGDELLWYQHSERVSGFDYRLGSVYTIPLGSDKISVSGTPTYVSTTPGGNYGNGNAEFMKNNSDILFSQRGLYVEASGYDKNVWKYTAVSNQIAAINPNTTPEITYLFTEIKRGVDGNYYMPNMGEQAEVVHSYSGGGFIADQALNPAPSAYQLASSLPTQVYKLFASANGATASSGRTIKNKMYELNDHLGNVHMVVSDDKVAVDIVNNSNGTNTPDGVVDYYQPDVMSSTDYYAFGSPMPGRNFQGATSYRYGFNSQEKDDEVYGVAGSLNSAEYWEYDTRLGKRWNVDPVVKVWESPYATFNDNPILKADTNGEDAKAETSSEDGGGGGNSGSCETCPRKPNPKPGGNDNIENMDKTPKFEPVKPKTYIKAESEVQRDNNIQYTNFVETDNSTFFKVPLVGSAAQAGYRAAHGEYSGAAKSLGMALIEGGTFSSITTSEGFLMGSVPYTLKSDLRVSLVASEKALTNQTFRYSTIAPNTLMKTQFFPRVGLQITNKMQPQLGPVLNPTIPAGTRINLGFTGYQQGIPGTWLQIYTKTPIKLGL